MELLGIWQREFYRECCALSGIGTKVVVGGFYQVCALLGTGNEGASAGVL
jgi:hypothetical protein